MAVIYYHLSHFWGLTGLCWAAFVWGVGGHMLQSDCGCSWNHLEGVFFVWYMGSISWGLENLGPQSISWGDLSWKSPAWWLKDSQTRQPRAPKAPVWRDREEGQVSQEEAIHLLWWSLRTHEASFPPHSEAVKALLKPKGRGNKPCILMVKSKIWKDHTGSEIWLWPFSENNKSTTTCIHLNQRPGWRYSIHVSEPQSLHLRNEQVGSGHGLQ